MKTSWLSFFELQQMVSYVFAIFNWKIKTTLIWIFYKLMTFIESSVQIRLKAASSIHPSTLGESFRDSNEQPDESPKVL
jgi:hypothetical protein